MTDRWDAEDIVAGTPLSGPDELVERVQDAISEALDEGHDEGHKEGLDEGHNEGVDSLVEALRDLDIEIGPNSTIAEVIEAVEKSHVVQFNQGVDALVAKLGTKRAAKVAETVWQKDD